MKKLLVLTAGVMLAVAVADADVIKFRDGVNSYTGTADIGIRQYQPNTASDTTVQMIGKAGTSLDDKMLIRFDLTSLTSGLGAGETIRIDSVSLFLRTDAEYLNSDQTAYLYAISAANAGWAEGISTYNHKTPSTVSWAGSAGLGTSGTDYNPTAMGSFVVDSTKGATDQNINTIVLSTNAVQGWVDNAANNAGMILVMDSAAAGEYVRFHTSFDSNALTIRPELTVNYTVVPEPATIGLFTVSCVSVLLLRRLQH